MESIIESIGSYKGHVFVIKFHSLGHRTGYVKLEREDVSKDVDSLEVHGGVTYHETLTPEVGQYLPPGTWVGFDCAHSWDQPDVPNCNKYFGKDPENYSSQDAEVRDLDFCIGECHKIIDQLLQS